MIRYLPPQARAAEPATGQIEVYLLAQAPLRTVAMAVCRNQHVDNHFRIDRRSACRSVKGSEMLVVSAQIRQGINLPEQVILRGVLFQSKLTKQCFLIGWQLIHHRHSSSSVIAAWNYPVNPDL